MIRNFTTDSNRPAKVVAIATHADKVSEAEKNAVWARLIPEISSSPHIVGSTSICSTSQSDVAQVAGLIEKAIAEAKLRGLEVPQAYQAVKMFIDQHKTKEPRMDFASVLRAFPSMNEHALEQALTFHQDMGNCVFNRKMGLVVLDPQFLADTFSRLLSFSNSWVKKGIVSESELKQIWTTQTPAEIAQTLELFKLHNLAFPSAKGDQWIVPSLLPRERPPEGLALPWNAGGNQRRHERVFEFHVIPVGMFGRLIARVQLWDAKDFKVVQYWGSGFQIAGQKEQAEVVLQEDQLSMTLRCVSSSSSSSAVAGKRSLTQLLVEECTSLFGVLFARTPDLAVRHFVTCPHCLASRSCSNEPTRFPYEECVQLVLQRAKVFNCGTEKVSVDQLGTDLTFGYVTVLGADEVKLESKPFAAGAFGSIFRGVINETSVVAKELKAEKIEDGFSEFQHEVSLMAALDHPNIVRLHGIMLNPLRMIMELCAKGDLFRALEAKRVNSPQLRLRIACDIAHGMNVLHCCTPPLAHRDLRSPNVLLSALDPALVCAKIADFGMTARVTERLRRPLESWHWMAPEAQSGNDYTEACDLYSFGIVLYEIYSGMAPFSEYDNVMRLIEVKAAVLEEPFLRPTMPPSAPEVVRNLAQSLWHHNPIVRPSFSDCIRLLDALKEDKNM